MVLVESYSVPKAGKVKSFAEIRGASLSRKFASVLGVERFCHVQRVPLNVAVCS